MFPERKNDDIQPSADSHITFRIPKAYLFCAVWAILCGVAVIYFERHQVRPLTNSVRGSITVQLASSLTGLDSIQENIQASTLTP